MANELYSHHHTHNPRYAPLPSYYASSRSLLTEPYVPSSSSSLLNSSSSVRYLSSTLSDPYLTSDHDFSAVSPAPSAAYEPHLARTAVNLIAARRSAKAFYEQSVLGSHSLIGQSEAWLSTNLLAKRPRLEGTNNLPVYPQRPGEKDCAHYMLTRTCKFGDACRFDHPIWVPASGIPNWKEGQQSSGLSLSFPERPGEPDCPYFLRTSNCKYGHNCKFNHPKDKLVSLPRLTSEDANASVLPERPSEPPCSYFLKTGKCMFGVNCKFNHPKDIHVPSIVSGTRMGGQFGSPKTDVTIKDVNQGQQLVAVPALHHNSKGLPIRLGEVDCPFYMKTGSCKYGAACRYSHPDRISTASNPAALNHLGLTSPAFDLNLGLVNPAVSILRSLAPRLSQTMLGLDEVIYPQRPGEIECDHYMKTGGCKFGEKCKFNHPIDRSDPNAVTLSFAGLPRREGATHCAFYMKTGTCKFGFRCKFDHPPPGEVMSVTEVQETNGKDDGNGEEGQAAPNVIDNLL